MTDSFFIPETPLFDYSSSYSFPTSIDIGNQGIVPSFDSAYTAQTTPPSFIPSFYTPATSTVEPSTAPQPGMNWADTLKSAGYAAGMIGDAIRAFKGEPLTFGRMAGFRMGDYLTDSRNPFSPEKSRLQNDLYTRLEERIRELERAQRQTPGSSVLDKDREPVLTPETITSPAPEVPLAKDIDLSFPLESTINFGTPIPRLDSNYQIKFEQI